MVLSVVRTSELTNKFSVSSSCNYLPLLFIFRVTLADCENEPIVPVMFKVKVPVGFFPVLTVMVDVPEPLIVLGLNDAVAPEGKPLTLSITVPLKPFTAATFAVYVVLAPFLTVCDAGVAVRVKVDTTSVTVVLCVRLPLVPVMVNV